jgi:iron complex outermembrane receptor protein
MSGTNLCAHLSVHFILLSSTAMAQNLEDSSVDLGTLFISADNRIETPVNEATRSVSVITREEIEEQGTVSQTVADVLSNSTPGFSPSTEALTDFGQTLRGRTFLTLIDGVPQSTPLRDGRRSLNSIDTASVERIEVVRGGNAAFGFGATGGTVNIVTKRPEEGEVRSFYQFGAGFSTTNPGDSIRFETQAGTTGRIGAFDFLLDGTFASSQSSFDADGLRIPSDTTGAQGGTADSDSLSLLAKFGYNFDDDRQRLQFSALYYDTAQDPEYGGISFAGDPANDVRTPAVRGNFNPVDPGTRNVNYTLQYSHEDFYGSELNAQLYWADITTTYGKFPGFPQTQIQSEKLGARVTVTSPLENPFGAGEGATLVWGIDALTDETRQIGTDIDTIFPGLGQPDPVLDQTAGAIFAQLELPVSDRLNISTGLRHEIISVDVSDFTFIDRSSGTPTPVPTTGGTLEFDETLFNLTASYDLTSELQLYGGFSQGFTVADIGRSLTDKSFATLQSVEAETQRTDNYELGLRYTGSRWDGTLVGFLSESDNGSSFDPVTLAIRKQPERITGIEATANYYVNDRMRLGGTLTYLEGEVDTNNDGTYNEDLPSTRIPPLKLTAYADFQVRDGWAARIQALYSGERDPNSTAFGGTSDIDSYVVVDAFSTFEMGQGQLSVGIKNLFNEDYTPVVNQAYDSSFAYARGPGQSVFAQYRVEF